MGNQLNQVELDQAILADLALFQLQSLGGNAHQQAEDSRSDDPAPPHAPAVAEVDQSVTDQTNQSASDGTEDDTEEGK